MFRIRTAATLALLLGATALAACAPQETPTPSTTASGAACAKDSLKTVTAGKLTIGTDQPVYPPWFVDDKPENDQGFEGAPHGYELQFIGTLC